MHCGHMGRIFQLLAVIETSQRIEFYNCILLQDTKMNTSYQQCIINIFNLHIYGASTYVSYRIKNNTKTILKKKHLISQNYSPIHPWRRTDDHFADRISPRRYCLVRSRSDPPSEETYPRWVGRQLRHRLCRHICRLCHLKNKD